MYIIHSFTFEATLQTNGLYSSNFSPLVKSNFGTTFNLPGWEWNNEGQNRLLFEIGEEIWRNVSIWWLGRVSTQVEVEITLENGDLW